MRVEEFDLDLASISPDLLEDEIEHHLSLKGYCFLGLDLSEDFLFQSLEDVRALLADGKFNPPPDQLVEGLLGDEGTGEISMLDLPDEEEYHHGDKLRMVDEALSDVSESCVSFLNSMGFESAVRSPSTLIRGGTSGFDSPELTEAECSHWLGTFNQAKLMLLLFMGPSDTLLELQPFGEGEPCPVKILTRPNSMVILRCDMLSRKHFSMSADYTLCSWITCPESNSGPRGWQLTCMSGAVRNPAARELQKWAQSRLEALYQMALQGILDEGAVPREWLRTMRHHFYRASQTPVGVFGTSGHLPGQHNPELVWQAMNNGADLVVRIPQLRWDHSQYYDSEPTSWMQSQFIPGGVVKTAVRHCAFIDGIEFFDNKCFDVSTTEAKGLDPMQRHLLETSYECFTSAGRRVQDLSGAHISVYTGAANPEWMFVNQVPLDDLSMTTASQAMLSNRISFRFTLKGPSTTMDCEMASAATALVMGAAAVSRKHVRWVESEQDCDGSLCSGVYFALTPVTWPRHGSTMNHVGRCLTFDQSANGYVRGEGCASLFLKRYAPPTDEEEYKLSEDFCHGTLVGSHMGNSGQGANMTAPHGPSEQECCGEALKKAGILGVDVDGMECNGLGRLLSDAVELTSLAMLLRGGSCGDRECLSLGTTKTHMGAAMEACGVLQILRVLYNVLYGTSAPSLHLRQTNPHIEVGQAAVAANNEHAAYRDQSVFHGVACRGFGGTHVNLVCWYVADKTRIMVDKPETDKREFAFWPGGGGNVPGEPLEGVFIVGSWNDRGTFEEMEMASDGSYRCTVTLGMSCFETFQIWMDRDDSKVLHPGMASAPTGCAVHGPSDLTEASDCRWRIDGREAWAPEDEGAAGSRGPRAAGPPRDAGRPGDQYEVRLLVAGKYRAVTWRKVKTAQPITQEMLGGAYYVVGTFNDYSFQAMTASAEVPGLYTFEVGPLPSGGGSFQICRNQDWDQMFYPSSASGERGCEVHGPDDSSTSLAWQLTPASSERGFRIQFSRTLEEGRDVKRLTWTDGLVEGDEHE